LPVHEAPDLRHPAVRPYREATVAGTVDMAVFDDTCGNLVQIVAMK
jgi:hypothetical protein